MNVEEVRALLLAQRGADESLPFGPGTLVYKVMGKMFALLPEQLAPGEMAHVSTKVEPHLGRLLRDTYPAIQPAWHLNKTHWISTRLDGSVPDEQVAEIIEHSYARVVQGLTRAQRAQLAQLG